MSLFFSLLPLYLFGNLHCASMCGPLVMLLAKHPHRWGYFLGRLFSFTLAGLLSAEMGMTLFSLLARFHLSASFSLLFGMWIVLLGVFAVLNIRLPASVWFAKRGAHLSVRLGKLMLKNSFHSVFLFGALTLILPCGQIVIVYSAIALNCSPLAGLFNGFCFALLTSPALICAMKASQFFTLQQKNYHLWMGGAAICIGCLAFLRGLADFNVIDHLVLNPSTSEKFHLVLY